MRQNYIENQSRKRVRTDMPRLYETELDTLWYHRHWEDIVLPTETNLIGQETKRISDDKPALGKFVKEVIRQLIIAVF